MLAAVVLAALLISPERPVVRNVEGPSAGAHSAPAVAAGPAGFFAVWTHMSKHTLGARFDRGGVLVETNIHLDGDASSADIVSHRNSYVVALTRPRTIELVEIDGEGRVTRRMRTINRSAISREIHLSRARIVRMHTGYAVAWTEVRGGRPEALLRVMLAMVDDDLRLIRPPVQVMDPSYGVVLATNGSSVLIASSTSSGVRFVLVAASGEISPLSMVGPVSSTQLAAASDGKSYVLAYEKEVVGISEDGAIVKRVKHDGVHALAWNGTNYVAATGSAITVLDADLASSAPMTIGASSFSELAVHGPQALLVCEAFGPSRVEATAVNTALGTAEPQELVSRGRPERLPIGAAWAGDTLGVLWWDNSQKVRLSRTDALGMPFDDDGLLIKDTGFAQLAATRDTFAVVLDEGSEVHLQILPADLHTIPEPKQLPIGDARFSSIASDGTSFLIVFSRPDWSLFAQHVAVDGTLLERHELPLRNDPRLASTGDGYVLLASSSEGPELLRVDRTGKPLGNPVRIAGYKLAGPMATSGTEILVPMRNALEELTVVAIALDGVRVTQGPALPGEFYTSLAWDGMSYLIAATGLEANEIRVRRVTVENDTITVGEPVRFPYSWHHQSWPMDLVARPGRAAITYGQKQWPPYEPYYSSAYVRIIGESRGRAVRR